MHSKGNSIHGGDLCKFYSRPLEIKTKQNEGVESESSSDTGIAFVEEKVTVVNPPKFYSVATQTDYRESEAQTDPWDPPFYINRTYKEPEVLFLKELSFGNGLPATQTEIKYILESRKNKLHGSSFEETYEDFLKKKKLVHNQVKNDWNYKISKHSEKQLDKLQQMKSSLALELSKQSEKKEKLLKNIWTQKNDQMTKVNSKLQKELLKKIKVLEDQSNFDAQKFDDGATKVTKSSKGLYYSDKHRNSLTEEMSHLLSKYYNNPNGLARITEWLERKKTELYNEIPLARPVYKDEREKLAEKAYQDLLDEKRTKMPPKIYREDYDKEDESVASSVKGEVEFDVLELPEEGVDLVTVFQQVLRGRAYQKQMIELVEKHKDALDVLLL